MWCGDCCYIFLSFFFLVGCYQLTILYDVNSRPIIWPWNEQQHTKRINLYIRNHLLTYCYLILSFYNSGNRFYTNTQSHSLTLTHISQMFEFFLALLWCGFVLLFFLAKPKKMCLVFFFFSSYQKRSILFGPFWSLLKLIFCIPNQSK